MTSALPAAALPGPDDRPAADTLAPDDATGPAPEDVLPDVVASGTDTPPVRWKPDILGSFWIGGTEFALPVDVMQEVVEEPEVFTPVPQSPPHVPGLFCLRDVIVPVVDLRMLLGFPPPEGASRRKVALIEHGRLRIGLLVDELGGVIDASGAPRVLFRPDADGNPNVVVEGVLKLDNGKRLIQLLDPFRLIGIEKLPRVGAQDVKAVDRQRGPRLNCITFQLGHTTCAMDLRHVQEIAEMPPLQQSQVAHGHTLGNIELRDITMPLVDLRGFIGRDAPFRPKPDTLIGRKIIVLKLPQGHVALMVYSIDSIVSYHRDDLLPFANVALPRHDLVAGCLVQADRTIVILLDHAKLIGDAALQEACTSCRAIYPGKPRQAVSDAAEVIATRATYVLFTVDVPLALDIRCVSEIMTRPDNLLHPPYALKFVHGILNLRGELITVIDPRVIYGLQPADHAGNKVLIFQDGTRKYGMIVDSVEEIVTLPTSDLLNVPKMSEGRAAQAVSADVMGCLQIPTRPTTSPPVMVLNLTSLIARCIASEAG